MNKLALVISMAVLAIQPLAAQKDKNKTVVAPDPVIMSVNKKPVTASEFSYVYGKNNSTSDNAYSEASIREYLKLYTNFKLKVTEAQSLGLDTSQAFQNELNGYKKQLAKPYLTEKNVTDALVKEAYERMKKEVNASHILIKLAIDAEPEDSLKAYKKIVEIREKALKGEDFGKLAKQFSDDPSAESNNGNLGYFTALQMVYPFETAAFTTPVGQISQPVRTRFGYHIVKVNNVRQAQGEIKVGHIMMRYVAGMDKEDSIAAKSKIDEIYTKLKKGGDWNVLCKEFSEDVASAPKGGELPWFSTNKMIASFEEAAFALKNPNDISEPVFTPYGWHIIKLMEKKPVGTFQELESSIKSKVSKDSRADLNKIALVNRLKKENNFKENPKSMKKAYTKVDTNLVNGKWAYKATDKDLNLEMFSLAGKKYTMKDFFDYVVSNQRSKKGYSPNHILNLAYKQYIENTILDYEESILESKYSDFKYLLNEYKEGIMLFQLMDEKVWSKAVQDTAGLKQFFNTNKEKYKWETRANAIVFSASSKDVLNKSLTEFQKGTYPTKEFKVENIYFEPTKTAISAEDQRIVSKLIDILNSDKNISVEINGYTDNKTTGAKNLALSNKRANAIADTLKKRGISATRIQIKGYGAAMPLANVPSGKKNNNLVSFNFYNSSFKTLERMFNETSALNLQVTEKKFQKGENAIVDAVKWVKGEYEVEKDGRFYKIIIKGIEDPTFKTIEESRGIATSDYQTFLEQEWINELRKKYSVEVNEAELKKLVKK
jgi:peptidyl-prolyl cis-trans isomerase SurA